jgi:hypothetical protein
MLGSIFDVVDDLLDEEFWLVANYVTWLTISAEEMATSHLATELYFNKQQGYHKWSVIFNWTAMIE